MSLKTKLMTVISHVLHATPKKVVANITYLQPNNQLVRKIFSSLVVDVDLVMQWLRNLNLKEQKCLSRDVMRRILR